MKISKEVKAGAIAILAIAGFVFLFQFMKGKNLFTTDNIFYAKYDNVEGLEQSSPVTINGLKVGQVDRIEPHTKKNGQVFFVVKLTVNNQFEFSKKSTVEIFEPGLMSGKSLRINLLYGNPLAKDGDTLQSGYKASMLEGLSQQVGPVKDQLQAALKTVDSLANNANRVLDERNRAEIRALLLNLNRTVNSLDGASRNANALLANNDPRIQRVLDDAGIAVRSADVAIGKYGTLAESIDTQRLNATIANLDNTVGQLNGVIAAMERGEGTMGKVLKDEQLYNNLQETSKNLNELVVDIKENPKRYLNFSVFGKNNSDKKVADEVPR